MIKLSIVSPYFNRKKELYRTLKTLTKSEVQDFEYVIVDDGSEDSQRIEDFEKEFKFIRLRRIDPKDKHHVNPCIPYNMAISMALGDIVLLQSPECFHLGDVLKYAVENTKNNKYIVFSCYSLGQKTSSTLSNVDFSLPSNELRDAVTKTIGGFTNSSCDVVGRYDSWFAHPVYRNCMFNFLASLTREDLLDLGGFDERFANGHAYDDTDFIARVLKKKMEFSMTADPFCVHQYHGPVLQNISNFHAKELKNKQLYEMLYNSPHYRVKNSFIHD